MKENCFSLSEVKEEKEELKKSANAFTIDSGAVIFSSL